MNQQAFQTVVILIKDADRIDEGLRTGRMLLQAGVRVRISTTGLPHLNTVMLLRPSIRWRMGFWRRMPSSPSEDKHAKGSTHSQNRA
jgi:hypothetical protein